MLPDSGEDIEYEQAKDLLQNASTIVPMTMPAFNLASLPVVRRWWYRKTVRVQAGEHWLRLPRNLINPVVWVDGQPQSIESIATLGRLMQPQLPFALTSERGVEIVVRTDCSASQHGPHGKKHETHSFWGAPALLVANPIPSADARWIGRSLRVRIGDQSWDIDHTELPASR